MADGFVWYELVTNDTDKAVAFYSKVVGWDVRDSGMPGMRYMIFGQSGKDVGGIMTWAGAGAPAMPPEWMAHIHSAKLDEELKAVVADDTVAPRRFRTTPPRMVIAAFAVPAACRSSGYSLHRRTAFLTSSTVTGFGIVLPN